MGFLTAFATLRWSGPPASRGGKEAGMRATPRCGSHGDALLQVGLVLLGLLLSALAWLLLLARLTPAG